MADDSRTRLVDAARQLFAERGYAATTTRAIADRAGVNEVTLFRRFGSKAALLHALVEDISTTVAGLTTQAPAPTAWTAEAVRTWLRTLVGLEIASADRTGALALRLAIEAAWDAEVAEAVGHGTSTNLHGLENRLAECQAHGLLRTDIAAELLAEAFFALTSNLVMSRSLLGSRVTRSDHLADQLTALFWSAASAPDTEGPTR